MDAPRILIAASGTGGHLIPALIIGRAVRRLEGTAEVEFVGSGRPLEAEIIDPAGFRRHEIRTVGLKRRGLLGICEFILTLPRAVAQTWRLLAQFEPDVILGVGGYVTFLPVTLGRLRGIPCWIHEAELSPGLANYVLAHYATRVSTAFAEAKMPRSSNVVYTGHPVRDELAALSAGSAAAVPRRLLIMGGSQGARALDQALLSLAPRIKELGLEVWHQARDESVAALESRYRECGVEARVVSFISNTAEAYGWSDLIISRAGAGTVMELGVVNRPAILVPYPYAQGAHQRANAQTLAREGKALLVEEGAEFEERLFQALASIVDVAGYRGMRERSFSGRKLDAAYTIGRGLLSLAGKSSGDVVDGLAVADC